MAQTIKEERLRWVLPIVMGDMRLVDVAKVLYCSPFVKLYLSWNNES
jgi:hypothetical protein